ncbi:intermembrane lipid transfer protein VPS13A-like isoform X2 [Ptychodera flava]|uniref:intermembrane lipid transfer protein VPS13A-like isoform X2 n=1 Tax=Ptychodera flava TaxID=63121 RepID=UPI00396A1FBA
MVFESIVTDLMNKYLGDFVENLDKSQLKLSIWGGDIVLNSLDLKESALDELDLPVKVKSGHLGKLTLNIPWKNLYSAPVVATIDGLYLLAVPNLDTKYDEKKDAKKKKDAKQKELDKVEVSKKIAKDKGKPTEEKSDSFAEKMAFQIIKNLQVQISNIHVRYEDRFTNPEAPFALGITLHDLSFQTCDTNWKKCLADSTSSLIHKLVELDCLAVYWNTNSRMYSNLPREQLRNILKDGIAGTELKPPSHQFLIKPISMKAQVRINPKPTSDMSIPKIFVNVVLEEIGVSLSKKQFRDLMELLESFERMVRNEPYRKYRPNVPAKGNAKQWWHYAQNCVLHENVKRKNNMWSWNNISKHRELMKKYKAAWKEKVQIKKPSKAVMDTIQLYEEKMNVFSIVLARQQAEMEVAKAGSKVKKVKSKGDGGGWFGGLFGGKKKQEKEKEPEQFEKDLQAQIAGEMSAEEKSKLYSAIDYSEDAADPTLPIEYVGMKFHFKLQRTFLQLTDSSLEQPEIVKLTLDDLYAHVQQRPSVDAFRLEAKIDSFSVYGSKHENGKIPQMVKSQRSDSGYMMSLLDVQVETNPLDGKADQRISVKARPLEIVFDAKTVNHVVNFFKPPEDVHLKQLQAAAFSKLDALKSQSASGLTHMIHTRKVTDITVDLKSSHIIIPERGVYDSSSSVLVINLGDFKMKSQQQDKVADWRKQQNLPIEELLLKAYDKFNIQLDSMQVLLARPGEDWMSARSEPKSSLHILEPTAINVQLQKCMVPNDVRMPAIKILGELPQLRVDISDKKVNLLVKLGTSIPLPDTSGNKAKTDISIQPVIPSSPEEITAGYLIVAPTLNIPGQEDIVLESDSDTESTSTVSDEFYTPSQSTEELVKKFGKVSEEPADQLTNLELQFEVKEVLLNISRWKNGKETPLLSMTVNHVGTEVKQRTYDLNVSAFIGTVIVEHKQYKGPDGSGPLYLINTQPSMIYQTEHLLSMCYKKVDRKSPEFYTTYEKTEQSVTVLFTNLNVVAHLDAILDLIEFSDSIVPTPNETKETDTLDDEGYISEEETRSKRRGRSTRPEPRPEIDIKIEAAVKTVSLLVCSEHNNLASVKVNGLEAGVVVQRHKTTVDASLKDIVVLDPTPSAKYSKILSIKDTQVLNLHVVAYNGATLGEYYSDMNAVDTEIKLTVGRIGMVFLNKFVSQVLEFVDHFQAAKDAVKDAGATAASSAKATVQDLHERSARVSLDITIQAPLIIVPQNSTSCNAIVADLGVLTLSNIFSIVDTSADKDSPPVDDMNISLHSVKLSRSLMTDSEDIIRSELLILEPVDITVDIKRNLAASWYHKIPNITIRGKLPALKISLEQNDFAMLMAILEENLGEGKKLETKSDATDSSDSSNDEVKSTAEEKKKVSKKEKTSAELTNTDHVWTNLVFSFEVESISTALYTGKTNLEGRDGIVSRNPSNGLSKADLFFIKVDGTLYTDNSMNTKVILGNLTMDDTRPGRDKGIYRMIEKYVSSKAGDTGAVNLVDLDFKQLSNQDKTINLKVKNLFICVCTEYLLTVADFFTKGLPKKEATDEKDHESKKLNSSKDAKHTNLTHHEKPTSSTRITLSIENPEIVLIADPNDLNTNAIVLQTLIDFKMDISPDRLSMGGNVNNLRIAHCPFNREKRAQVTSKVLHPCSVSFHLSQPQDEGQHIDLNLTEIAINVSPRIIQTISAVAASVKPPTQPDEEEKIKEAIPKDIWAVKKLTECNFWFLKEAKPIEEADAETGTALIEQMTQETKQRGDILIMKIERIKLTLEACGEGRQTVPMLMLEANITAEVKDWTSQLYVNSDISMEMSYYNDNMAEWEPLLEPVEVHGGHRQWELKIEVQKTGDESVDGADDDDSSSVASLDLADIPPVMSITISSNDVLELTMTKSCINLLTKLGKAFSDAVNQPEASSLKQLSQELPPFVLKNHLGETVTVEPCRVFQESKDAVKGKVKLKSGESLSLYPKSVVKSLLAKKSFLRSDLSEMRREMSIQVEGFKEIFNIPINRACKRLYNLIQLKGYPHITYSLVVHIEADIGGKVINIRSPLQITNAMPYAMELAYFGTDNQMIHFGKVEAKGIAPVPLLQSHGESIYTKPVDMPYALCDSAISWESLWNLKQSRKPNPVFKCNHEKEGNAPYHFTVSTEKETYEYISGTTEKTPVFTLHILPTVKVKNLLPCKVICTIQGAAEELSLEGGEIKSLFNADLSKILEIRIPDYRGKEWTAKMTLRPGMKQLSGWKFTAFEGKEELSMELGVHVDYDKGFKNMALYAPYWMVNNTGLPLAYKGTDDKNITTHPADLQEPLLFTFGKQLLGKKKASLQVEDSEWSDKFSLDTVGSSGSITCKSKDIIYEVGVKIHLSNAALTKVVTLTPMYLVVNHADIILSVAEAGTKKWRDIAPGECLPFWPETSSRKHMKMQLKSQNCDEPSQPFIYNKAGNILLKMDDPEIGGIGVMLSVSEWSNIISLNSYHRGIASVQIINHCTDTMLQYQQTGNSNVKFVNAKETVLYTWQDPCGKHELTWSMFKTSKKDKLLSDGIGEFEIGENKMCYWISFLDGMQRTLMFTEDLALATVAQQAGELEQAEVEVNLSLQGIGLSLVNNTTGTEIAYSGITSSGIVWEFQKRRRWKTLKVKQVETLENEFKKIQQQYQLGKQVPTGVQALEGGLEVDFEAMKMIKPNKRKIRRTYQPGVWVKYKTSEHQLQFHAKINRLQVDNQLPASVFPTILAPVPPPKSVVAESEPKPFTELSIMTRYGHHTNIKQVKYFKLLIQEMHAKIDQGFLNALLLMFEAEEVTPEQQLVLFNQDLEHAKEKLEDSQEVQTAMGEERNFYDNFHLSPIKIHLSFSLHDSGDDPGSDSTKKTSNAPAHLLLQSVGVTLTNVQDVIFKLAFFERQHQFYTSKELSNECVKHYSSQAIKQAYVLVLGLDVLGNPFGFVRGLTEGVTDLFYEPYQGAVQGPEEFAEGLALGVRSLFGHAIGGAAGVVSRVTGTLGKGLAALTMDEEYQKKRLQAMNQRPADLKEGLARGGKGLVMGFVEGVSGIVTQPVKGAKKEGATGFFKGVGKGLVGVVAKPTGGVIDMASSAFDGIRRVAETSDEVQRLRPPRNIHVDGIVRPYIRKEAEGYGIFIEIEKGKYVNSDHYFAHGIVTKDGKNVLLVTDKRIMFVMKGEILGHWNCEWQYTYGMLKEPPHFSDKGITILIKEDGKKKKKGFAGLFGGGSSSGKQVPMNDDKKAQAESHKKKKKKRKFTSFFSKGSQHKVVIQLDDSNEAQWLVSKMHEAMAKNTL